MGDGTAAALVENLRRPVLHDGAAAVVFRASSDALIFFSPLGFVADLLML